MWVYCPSLLLFITNHSHNDHSSFIKPWVSCQHVSMLIHQMVFTNFLRWHGFYLFLPSWIIMIWLWLIRLSLLPPLNSILSEGLEGTGCTGASTPVLQSHVWCQKFLTKTDRLTGTRPIPATSRSPSRIRMQLQFCFQSYFQNKVETPCWSIFVTIISLSFVCPCRHRANQHKSKDFVARLAIFLCSDASAGSYGSPLGCCGDSSALILVAVLQIDPHFLVLYFFSIMWSSCDHMMTYCSCDVYCSVMSIVLWPNVQGDSIAPVTPIVPVTLLLLFTISTSSCWPYSLRLDFLYLTVHRAIRALSPLIPCPLHSRYLL